MKDKKIRIMQQALAPNSFGGVSTEFRALTNSSLKEEFEFIPLICNEFHGGVNFKDIKFYYNKIKATKPDIVQVRGACVDGLNAQIAARLVKGTKIMLCVHGMYSDIVYYSPIKKWISKHIIENLCFLLCDGISFVYSACEKRNNFKAFKKKIIPFVYNRIPDFNNRNSALEREEIRSEFGLKENDILGIFCGRVTKEKGLSYLVEALNKIKNENLHIIIVGEGNYLEEFKHLVSLNEYKGPVVHFVGAKYDVEPYLSASDFFIMPSLHENHSIALLEAMAAGLPTVSTNVGGNPEIVKDGQFGILINPYDSETLKNGINEMCDSKIRNQFALNIKKYDFNEFSNTNVDNQLRSAYLKILNL